MPILDKFYTKKEIATQCYNFLINKYPEVENCYFLEPSAGAGNFLPNLKNYIALDIKPEGENIVEQDFLLYNTEEQHYITIGNPPFGKRSKLAIDFFNHAAKFSDIIAFIVPVSFMKWSVQKNLDINFALCEYFYLNENSFLADGEEYSVRTVFQIWVKKDSQYYKNINNRLISSPPTSHTDFQIWQYNATPEAIKFIDEDWTIATYRQGYHEYNDIFSRSDYDFIKDKMTGAHKQQFFFIKPLTKEADGIIKNMDFNALAARNTATPGFGKGDFVQYYIELKNDKK